jgi:hypothetical protein
MPTLVSKALIHQRQSSGLLERQPAVHGNFNLLSPPPTSSKTIPSDEQANYAANRMHACHPAATLGEPARVHAVWIGKYAHGAGAAQHIADIEAALTGNRRLPQHGDAGVLPARLVEVPRVL